VGLLKSSLLFGRIPLAEKRDAGCKKKKYYSAEKGNEAGREGEDVAGSAKSRTLCRPRGRHLQTKGAFRDFLGPHAKGEMRPKKILLCEGKGGGGSRTEKRSKVACTYFQRGPVLRTAITGSQTKRES